MVGGFLLALVLLWLFAPKVELYYLLEKTLKERNIVIANETITDTWYGLKIEDATLYVAGAKVAQIAKLNFNFSLFYNTLKIDEVKMDKSLSNMAPKEIKHFKAIYSVLNPLKIKLEAEGSFGVAEGSVDLKNQKVEILFPVTKDIKTIKRFLKKDKERGWVYETNY
jgi:hypothetical protein